MSYQIKSYRSWKQSRVNEGIVDMIKNVSKRILNALSKIPGLSWIGKKFAGDGSTMMNIYLNYMEGNLPKGIEVYPSKVVKDVVDTVMDDEEIKKNPPKPLYSEDGKPLFNTEGSVSEGLDLFEVKVELEHPNINILNIKSDQLIDILEERVEQRISGSRVQQKPIMIWGAPGIGKTQIIKQVAEKYDMNCITFILSVVPPDNILLPGVDPETGKQKSIPSGALPLYYAKGPGIEVRRAEADVPGPDGKPRGGILFFDEISRAPKANLNMALSLLEDRQIEDWKIGDKWFIVAAGNRDFDDPDIPINFSTALGGRFDHINLVPDVESWASWAKEQIDDETGELIFDDVMIEFLKMNREIFYDLDPDVSKEIYPTPRTWDAAARSLYVGNKKAKEKGKKLTYDDILTRVSLAVGKAAAAQYVGYLKLLDAVDPKTLRYVYTDPSKATLPKMVKGEYVSDVASVMITAITLDKRGEKLTDKEFENVADYAIRLDNPTWATILMRRILQEHPYINPLSDEYAEVYERVLDKMFEKYPGFDPDYNEG